MCCLLALRAGPRVSDHTRADYAKTVPANQFQENGGSTEAFVPLSFALFLQHVLENVSL